MDQFFIFEALASSQIQRFTFQFVHCRSFRVPRRPCFEDSCMHTCARDVNACTYDEISMRALKIFNVFRKSIHFCTSKVWHCGIFKKRFETLLSLISKKWKPIRKIFHIIRSFLCLYILRNKTMKNISFKESPYSFRKILISLVVSDYLGLGSCVLRVPWYVFRCLECKNIAYIGDFLSRAIWPPPSAWLGILKPPPGEG